MGRKLTLTDELIKEFEQIIGEGNNYNTAFEYLGVPKDTYYSWLRRADEALEKKGKLTKSEHMYVNFAHVIKKARNYAKRRHQAVIAKIDPENPDWKKSAWWLERNYPEEYALRGRLDIHETKNINVAIQENINIEVAITDEKAERIADIFAEQYKIAGRTKLPKGTKVE